MVLTLFAFLAGLVTVLAPCILPILPIVLSGGSVQGRLRPWGIIVGVVASFSLFTLTLSWLVRNIGLSPEFGRWFGIVILFGLGLLLLIPRALDRFEAWVSARLSRNGPTPQRHGFGGGVLLGLSLGAVWTPCAGPILAAVVGATQSGQVTGQLVGVTIAYAIGAAVPMGLIAALGQRITSKVRWFVERSGAIQRTFGVIVIVVALLMATGLDRKLQTAIIQATPNWLPQLQDFENRVNLDPMRPATRKGTSTMMLENYGPAPALTGITGWINSQPLTLKNLQGHVVLLKFWTYSCINCIRTLPYVQAWYDKYHDQGFEIIAVHTPEFEFEKVPVNVEKATKDFKITYPVALDPNYATWNAYRNRYWPAKYLIDANGNVRYVHFGEGNYDVTERAIQTLLSEAGRSVTNELLAAAGLASLPNQTPETYYGTARAKSFVSPEPLTDGSGEYSLPAVFQQSDWALSGLWTVTPEYVEAAAGNALEQMIQAKDMYVVMDGTDNQPRSMNIYIDGQPGSQVAVIGSTVDEPALYRVASFPEFGSHRVRLEFPTGGVRLYAATFGSSDPPGMACSPDGRCSVEPIQ